MIRRAISALAMVLAVVLAMAVAWVAPGAALAGGPGKPTLGMNLATISDWSVEQPFLDVMKTARPWFGHKPGQWGGMSHDALVAAGVFDAHGWPRKIPAGLRSVGTLVLVDLPEGAAAYAGRYRLRFEGSGIVEVGGRAQNVRYGPGEVRFDFTPGESGVDIRINRTSADDPVRNITLVREDQAEAFDAGALFNPVWLAAIAPFGTLRFMDWMLAYPRAQVAWESRPQVDDASYTEAGVPLEVMIALANEIGADAWVSLPHRVDDDYVRRFAEMVHEGLRDDLKAYVEYSNEVWNWQFEQTVWAEEQAKARWGEDYRHMEFYGMRAAEIARIWTGEFAGADRARLVTVISTQTGWLGLEAQALEAPLYVAEAPGVNRPPAEAFDAYAITGYFGHGLGSERQAARLHGWLEAAEAEAEANGQAAGLTGEALAGFIAQASYAAMAEKMGADLRDGSLSGEVEDSLDRLMTEIWPHHRDVAARYGLDLIAYEAGTHLVGSGAVLGDEALSQLFQYVNYSPQMANLYREMFDGWAKIGGGMMALYSDVVRPSGWGSWGNLRFLGDRNPRWEAVLERAEAWGR